jgi:hypothetical protein
VSSARDGTTLSHFLARNVDDHGGNEDLVVFFLTGGKVSIVKEKGFT